MWKWHHLGINVGGKKSSSVTIAQWENEWISLSVLPVALGSILSHGKVFQGIFLWLITLCQPVLSQRGRKWFNLLLIGQWHHTACEQRGGRPKSNHEQTMAEKYKEKKEE